MEPVATIRWGGDTHAWHVPTRLREALSFLLNLFIYSWLLLSSTEGISRVPDSVECLVDGKFTQVREFHVSHQLLMTPGCVAAPPLISCERGSATRLPKGI